MHTKIGLIIGLLSCCCIFDATTASADNNHAPKGKLLQIRIAPNTNKKVKPPSHHKKATHPKGTAKKVLTKKAKPRRKFVGSRILETTETQIVRPFAKEHTSIVFAHGRDNTPNSPVLTKLLIKGFEAHGVAAEIRSP
jgi:hypothetical protein